jgi:hypothetical protein
LMSNTRNGQVLTLGRPQPGTTRSNTKQPANTVNMIPSMATPFVYAPNHADR